MDLSGNKNAMQSKNCSRTHYGAKLKKLMLS